MKENSIGIQILFFYKDNDMKQASKFSICDGFIKIHSVYLTRSTYIRIAHCKYEFKHTRIITFFQFHRSKLYH